MAQKQVQIYDDSVLKLSIKQGEEKDRFPFETVDAASIDYESTSVLPGAFTMGELAYTRDTNRVFVGNFTTDREQLYDGEKLKIQQTVGGTLAGNKYLGYVDSKPEIIVENDVVTPLALGGENGILCKNSPFRSYEFSTLNENNLTEDGNWSRQSFYNKTYDAYDGDYMYDIYRNALIIFDHNIKPTDENVEESHRRKSKIVPLDTDNKEDNTKAVYEHTLDMYGDGYVCIYNVIPDGDTLTFDKKAFNDQTGEPIGANNYTQNIIKVQKVYAPAMMNALDGNMFMQNENMIQLQTSQTFNEIKTSNEDTYFTIPNKVALKGAAYINFSKFANATSKSNKYLLTFGLQNNIEGDAQLDANFVDYESLMSPAHTIQLGPGLKAGDGSSSIKLDRENNSAKLLLDSNFGQPTLLNKNPFNIDDDDSTVAYTSNLIVSTTGSIIDENKYEESYATKVKAITDKYDNENTKLNYFIKSTPILKPLESLSDKQIKFRIEPVVYNPENITEIESIGIFDDIELSVEDDTDEIKTIEIDTLRDIWFWAEHNFDENVPSDYISKSGKMLEVFYPLNAVKSFFDIEEDSESNIKNIILKNSEYVEVSKDENGFSLSVHLDDDEEVKTFNAITTLYNSHTLKTYSELDEILADFENTELIDGKIKIYEFYTNDLNVDEYPRLEFKNSEISGMINIPLHKYLTCLTRDNDTLSCAEVQNITSIKCYKSIITADDTSKEEFLYELPLSSGKHYIDENVLISGNNREERVYRVEINGDGKYTFDLITNMYNLVNKKGGRYFKESDAEAVETLSYNMFGKEEESVEVIRKEINLRLHEYNFFISNEININSYFDDDFHYYNNDFICRGGSDLSEEAETEWVNKRKLELKNEFPIVPSHASSIILECKAGENDSISIKQVSRNVENTTDKIEAILPSPKSGIKLPSNLAEDTAWTTDKLLATVENGKTAYVELPISIDDAGNKHFKFKLDFTTTSTSSKSLISLAAYRA